METTKEITKEFEDTKYVATIRKLKFKEMETIARNLDSKTVGTNQRSAKEMIETVNKCTLKLSNPDGVEFNKDDLDLDVGKWLYEEIGEFSGLDLKKKESESEPSVKEPAIQ